MQNLAGDKECDRKIRRELERCGIEVVEVELDTVHNEVPFTLIGKLGPFTFRRLWYYYEVEGGKIPLNVAEELYANTVGKTDIRVSGHCGCPPPSEWAHWFHNDDSLPIHRVKERDEYLKFRETHPDWFENEPIPHWSDEPEKIGKGYVLSYHIDSELGLYIFAETIKKHGLDKQ